MTQFEESTRRFETACTLIRQGQSVENAARILRLTPHEKVALDHIASTEGEERVRAIRTFSALMWDGQS